MENARDYLRANNFSAGVWNNYDEIPGGWNWFVSDPARITSIGPGSGRRSMPRAVGFT
jgi:hypothetical protein